MPDRPSDKATRRELDDRFRTISERIDGHWRLDDERWSGNRDKHRELTRQIEAIERSARRSVKRREYQGEHKALDVRLSGMLDALDAKVDTLDRRIGSVDTEQRARRGLLSDGRSVLATAGIIFGLISTVLLILDRLPK